jgi:transposase
LKKLYKIEDQIKDFSVNEKYRIRQEKSVPILTEMKTWLDQLRDKIVPKSEAGKAVIYALNEWPYLIRYCDDGKLNISNAWVENAIRPFALGRKNYLFSDTIDGANASAMLYRLIETAKANDIQPFGYLLKVLEKIPYAESVDHFEALLPLKSLIRG